MVEDGKLIDFGTRLLLQGRTCAGLKEAVSLSTRISTDFLDESDMPSKLVNGNQGLKVQLRLKHEGTAVQSSGMLCR